MMNKKRPNILLIMADQQRFDTIGALGNPVIRTPNLDRLCREGTAFTGAYTPSPVCVAARCSMIFGQYPFQTGCYENTPMPGDRQSLMQALTDAGYRTHGIGKCHFCPDLQALRGFESRETQEELVLSADEDDYLKYLHKEGYDYVCDPHGIRSEMYYVPQPSQLPAKHHPSQWIGDRACSWIEKSGKEKRPWFLFSSFVHPHPPFSPPNPWHKLYRAPNMPLPRMPLDTESLITYVNRVQNRYKFRDRGLDLNLIRTLRAYYYACISFVDFQIGRILESLRRAGRMDDTLILFTSDHGEHLGDYGCFGKRSMHDTSARIPLIARLPGAFKKGALCNLPVSLVDIAPTILSLAKASCSTHALSGRDLAETAHGKNAKRVVFAQHAVIPHQTEMEIAARSTYMAVNEGWKYFYSAPDNREFLFDRIRDPLETSNLAASPYHAEEKTALKSALHGELKKSGSMAGINGEDWRAFSRICLPEDPDAGLIVQDHPWARTDIPGYDDAVKKKVRIFF